MKQMLKYSRVTGYLEKIYRTLNTDFFAGELEEPVITIQSTRGAYGHVTCGKVWKVNKDSESCERYELNIAAGTLDRPIESVVSTMLHEMVHIYHLMNGIQDTSRNCTYHNKKFKEKAESVGLIIEHDSRIGWSITSPSEMLIDYIISQGWSEILINRNDGISYGGRSGGSGSSDSSGREKRPSSTRKYICPCCGMSVRATRQVNIICGDCNNPMQVAG